MNPIFSGLFSTIAGEWASYWVFANWCLALSIIITVIALLLLIVCSLLIISWKLNTLLLFHHFPHHTRFTKL
jgi:hypothetical protein